MAPLKFVSRQYLLSQRGDEVRGGEGFAQERQYILGPPSTEIPPFGVNHLGVAHAMSEPHHTHNSQIINTERGYLSG